MRVHHVLEQASVEHGRLRTVAEAHVADRAGECVGGPREDRYHEAVRRALDATAGPVLEHPHGVRADAIAVHQLVAVVVLDVAPDCGRRLSVVA